MPLQPLPPKGWTSPILSLLLTLGWGILATENAKLAYYSAAVHISLRISAHNNNMFLGFEGNAVLLVATTAFLGGHFQLPTSRYGSFVSVLSSSRWNRRYTRRGVTWSVSIALVITIGLRNKPFRVSTYFAVSEGCIGHDDSQFLGYHVILVGFQLLVLT